MDKILDFKPINDFAASLILLSGYEKFARITEVICEDVASISGADRSCLFVLRDNNLIIEGGFPKKEHGIDEKARTETGEDFLKQLMENKSMVLIPSVINDYRTSYMKQLAERYGIRSTLFVPLFSKEKSLGIIVLDFTNNGKRFGDKEWFLKMRFVANLIAQAVLANKNRREKERELKRIEKLSLIGKNTAQLSHTVLNSLASIGGFARRLKKIVAGKDANAEEYADIISGEVIKAENIVKDVLRFSRSLHLNYTLVNINHLISDAADKLKKGGIIKAKVVSKMDEKLNRVRIRCDGQKISECIQELLLNAEQAGSKIVQICTKLSIKQNRALIIITNNGIPIDSNVLSQIFEPFMTTKADGTGLGLANTQMIVEAHGGEISTSNKEHGTEFTIALPFSHKN